MLRKLVDITGTENIAPACPNCSTKNNKVALAQQVEIKDYAPVAGIFRCPRCFHAFRYVDGV